MSAEPARSADADAFRIGASTVDKFYIGANLVWTPPDPPAFFAVRSATIGSGTASSLSVTPPAGVTAGMVAVLVANSGSGIEPVICNAGWTVHRTDTSGVAVNTIKVASKVIAADAATVITVTNTSSRRLNLAVAWYSGSRW